MIGRLRKDERGVAAVEAALIMPLLLALSFAAADAGNLLLERHRIKTSLATAARLLARSTAPESLEAEARNLATNGVRGGGSPLVPGWTPAQIAITYRWVDNVSDDYNGGPSLRVVRMESRHAYSGFGLLQLVGVNAVSIDAVHEERWTGG